MIFYNRLISPAYYVGTTTIIKLCSLDVDLQLNNKAK